MVTKAPIDMLVICILILFSLISVSGLFLLLRRYSNSELNPEAEFPLGPSFLSELERQSASLAQHGLQIKIRNLGRRGDMIRVTCVLEWLDDRSAFSFMRPTVPIEVNYLNGNKERL